MTKYFNQICEFRQKNPIIKGSAIRTDNPILHDVKIALSNLKDELHKRYKKFEGIDFTVEISKGAANFPNITHVCILPPGQKVSDGIYVAICFDKLGKGAVVGCAESKTNSRSLNIVVRKKGKYIPILDIDGGSEKTKYNNVYENPKDFYYKLENEVELENHIKTSLSLCLYNLKLTKHSQHLQIKNYLNSTINENEIEYFNLNNIQDDRKKIAIQIHARRGQKLFRKKLIDTYNKKCAVTNCEIVEMLEAAHIYSFRGSDTDKIPNGLLLRSDIHTLFDLGLISINPNNYLIQVSNKIINDEYYAKLHGVKINLPKRSEDYPNQDSLKHHFENVFDI
ncbi:MULTISPECIES: HNH endonuclease [unclassified Chryseobacterium]|uniref:HNH endonuclease n=1 Tax=unclassified Chryseobacterium TaxID=2593645 RepID=UPI00300FCB4F